MLAYISVGVRFRGLKAFSEAVQYYDHLIKVGCKRWNMKKQQFRICDEAATLSRVGSKVQGSVVGVSSSDFSLFSQCVFVMAKGISKANLFRPLPLSVEVEHCRDSEYGPAREKRVWRTSLMIAPSPSCPSFSGKRNRALVCKQAIGEAVKLLSSFLYNIHLVEPDVEKALEESMHSERVCGAEEHYDILRDTLMQAGPAAIGFLRPLHLLLQQYVLRQHNFGEELAMVAAWLAPLVFPNFYRRDSTQAKLLASVLVAQAMRIFNKPESPPTPLRRADNHSLPPLAPRWGRKAVASKPRPAAPKPEEVWEATEEFKPVLNNLISQTIMMLFSDEDDADSIGCAPVPKSDFDVEMVSDSDSQDSADHDLHIDLMYDSMYDSTSEGSDLEDKTTDLHLVLKEMDVDKDADELHPQSSVESDQIWVNPSSPKRVRMESVVAIVGEETKLKRACLSQPILICPLSPAQPDLPTCSAHSDLATQPNLLPLLHDPKQHSACQAVCAR
eukprot:gene15988-22121_t